MWLGRDADVLVTFSSEPDLVRPKLFICLPHFYYSALYHTIVKKEKGIETLVFISVGMG